MTMSAAAEADFCKCLEPFRVFSVALGLETFQGITEERPGGRRKIKLKRSIPATVYMLFLMLVLIIVDALLLCFVFRYEIPSYHFSISVICFMITVTISSFVSMITMSLNSESRQEMINYFVEVDEILMGNAQEYYTNWAHRLRRFLKCTSLAIFTAYVVQQLRMNASFWEHIIPLVGIMKYLILFLTALTYLNLVFLVKQRFVILNRKLREVQDTESVLGVIFPLRSTLVHPRAARSQATTNHSHLRNTDSLNSQTIQELTTKKIYSLRVAQRKLCKTIKLTNSAYGVPLCLMLTINLFAIVFSTYKCFIHIFLLPNITFYTNETFLINSTVLTLLFTTLMVMIIFGCASTTKKGKVTQDIIQDMLLQQETNKELCEQLMEFSKQISEKELYFKVAGIFAIDLPLIISAFESAMSCVLVMHQTILKDN